MIVGGGDDKIELYFPAEDRDSVIAEMDKPRQDHSCALLPDGNVLLTGGKDIYKRDILQCEIIDSASLKTTPGANLPYGITGHATTALADAVLLTGGTPNEKCLLYRAGQWMPVASMNVRRWDHAMAASDSHAFVVGGYTRSAEQFDPHCNKWTLLPEIPAGDMNIYERPTHSIRTAAFHHGQLCVVAKFESQPQFQTLLLDPREGRWRRSEEMDPDHSFCGLVTLDDRLYGVGKAGFRLSNTVKTWDAAANRWLRLPEDMKQATSGSAIVALPIC